MSDKSGHFLTVNSDAFVVSPVARKRHITRKQRLASPDMRPPSPAVSADESLFAINDNFSIEDLRPSSAACKCKINNKSNHINLNTEKKSFTKQAF